jgi:hypothetical protein
MCDDEPENTQWMEFPGFGQITSFTELLGNSSEFMFDEMPTCNDGVTTQLSLPAATSHTPESIIFNNYVVPPQTQENYGRENLRPSLVEQRDEETTPHHSSFYMPTGEEQRYQS